MKILNLTVNEFMNGLEHVIEYVHWEHEGIKGSTKLNPPKELFHPLESLAEKEIISWVWAIDRKKIEKFVQNSQKLSLNTEFGTVPTLSPQAEETKKEYWVSWATKRLEQYVLLEGRPEIKEMLPSGEEIFNEETGLYENVLVETITQTYIEPLEEFVQITTEEGSIKDIRNPLVVKDEEERAKAAEILETYSDS